MSLDSIPEELVQQYVLRRKSEIGKIKESLLNSDFETVNVIGHRMKGNGVSFGFPELTDLGEQLESAAQASDRLTIEVLLGHLNAWAETH